MVAGGNDVRVYVKVSNSQGSTAFVEQTGYKILGKNPSSSQITAETNTTPWFIDRLIQQESSNRQFSTTTGLPSNNGNGFGLMQVDNPAPSDRALWDWRQNIEEGVAVIELKRLEVTRFWNEQVSQFNTYNITHPSSKRCCNR